MTLEYAISKLTGLKTDNLEIINIDDNNVVEFIYLGVRNFSEIELIGDCVFLKLNERNDVMILINNIK